MHIGFIARHMGVAMQHNINVPGGPRRGDMNENKPHALEFDPELARPR